MARALCGALALALLAAPAAGQDSDGVTIAEIKVQAFLERSGRFSDDLAGSKKPLKNLPRPGNELGEPAEALLVTLVFQGPKNGESSRQLSRDMATVSVKQSKGEATRSLLYRAMGGFFFGEDGRARKAFMLDEASCDPLEIEVKVGRSRKLQKLDLSCDAPPAEAAAKPKRERKGRAAR